MLEWVPTRFPRWKVNDIDGVKATGNREWVHLRLSNTEPVMRIIAEADTESRARELADIGRSFVEAVKP
jgi:phosphomannomutase